MPRRAPLPPPSGRRALLRAGAALAPLLARPARADHHDQAWRRILARGRIRFASGIWMARLPVPPAPSAAPSATPWAEPVEDPFHAALAAHLAATLGLRHSFDLPRRAFETLQHVVAGEADVALGPMLNRLTARQLMFTPPYAELETVILSAHVARRRRLADWRGLRLGLQDGYVAHLTNLGFDLEEARAQPFTELAALEEALLDGALDAVITTNVTARNIMARHPGRGFGIRTSLTPHLHGAAVRFGEHELLRAITIALHAVQEDGTLAHLFALHAGAPLVAPREGL
ncbi:substrate-binding periplasmic protein [Roseococcus microcysteis]|uniref:substrate-binding periplasmic protein n=1 Tax=Roseococcus microcysteis TaxID=2771361 RepID=UPI00168AD68D|nr:transporter substrate-binding domain-containing protein [Roseococcus microcysteis]